MKIKNETKYKTKQLRKILKWCLDYTGMTGDNLTVRIIYRRTESTSNFVTGYAYLGHGDSSGRNFICIRLPKKPENVFSHKIATSFIHELAHTRGVQHADLRVDEQAIMRHAYWTDNPFQTFEIRKPKPKENFRELRYKNAIQKVRKYTGKAKRTQNLLKKWQKKLKYYEKKKVN